jgi:hypothetical protein
MNYHRRIDIDRRVPGERRANRNSKDYKGPERRSVFDRRKYNDRRQNSYEVS